METRKSALEGLEFRGQQSRELCPKTRKRATECQQSKSQRGGCGVISSETCFARRVHARGAHIEVPPLRRRPCGGTCPASSAVSVAVSASSSFSALAAFLHRCRWGHSASSVLGLLSFCPPPTQCGPPSRCSPSLPSCEECSTQHLSLTSSLALEALGVAGLGSHWRRRAHQWGAGKSSSPGLSRRWVFQLQDPIGRPHSVSLPPATCL